MFPKKVTLLLFSLLLPFSYLYSQAEENKYALGESYGMFGFGFVELDWDKQGGGFMGGGYHRVVHNLYVGGEAAIHLFYSRLSIDDKVPVVHPILSIADVNLKYAIPLGNYFALDLGLGFSFMVSSYVTPTLGYQPLVNLHIKFGSFALQLSAKYYNQYEVFIYGSESDRTEVFVTGLTFAFIEY